MSVKRSVDPGAPAYIRHQGLVRIVIRRYFLALLHQGYDYDDLVQEGLLELWRAESGYRPEMGTEANYYARCIYNGIKNRCMMPLTREKRKANVDMIELDAPIRKDKQAHGKVTTRMDMLPGDDGDFISQIAEADTLRRYMKKLAPYPRLALAIRLRFEQEMTYMQMGLELGMTWQGARYNVEHALEVMRG
jgi:RNA polymerase sigma factor (sigma-70 family)